MMKLFTLLLVLGLLLAGCTHGPAPTQPSDPTQLPTEPSTDATEDTQLNLYIDNSRLEQVTQGAVRVYDTRSFHPLRLAALDDGVALVCADEVVLLQGDTLQEQTSFPLPQGAVTQQTSLVVGSDGFGFLLEDNAGVVIFRTGSGVRVTRFPEDMAGTPVLSRDLENLYYATQDQFRVLNLSTGLSRTLRSGSQAQREVVQLLFDDILLVRQGKDILVLRTDNGLLLGTLDHIPQVVTGRERFYLTHTDYIIERTMAVRGGTEQLFLPYPTGTNTMVMDLDVGAAVLQRGIYLDYYDLDRGLLTCQVMLDPSCSPRHIAIDPQGQVWFLDGQGQLCCWNPASSPAQEQVSCYAVYHTRDNPDTQQLQQVQLLADSLGKEYGVDIRVHTQGVSFDDFTVLDEYRPEALRQALQEVETGLKAMDSRILEQLGKPVLHLVWSIQGDAPGCFVQRMDGRDHLVVSMDGSLSLEFFRGMYLLMDRKILPETSLLDGWSNLNPEGFGYLLTYPPEDTLQEVFDTYKDSGLFTDPVAVTFPREDRACVFAHAMLHTQQGQSSQLQGKRTLLKRAINKAFDLEYEYLPWGNKVW